MSVCPSCGQHNQKSAKFCGACGQELLKAENARAHDWVTLTTFSNPIEAHLARTKLESEGIEAEVFDENPNYFGGCGLIGGGWVKLKVAPAKVTDARKVLQL